MVGSPGLALTPEQALTVTERMKAMGVAAFRFGALEVRFTERHETQSVDMTEILGNLGTEAAEAAQAEAEELAADQMKKQFMEDHFRSSG